jgi:hypothetical protein
VTPIFTYQPVQLAEGTPDREGLLVFWGADLLAVLVCLSPETHDGQGGLWFLEAGFGVCADKSPPLFRTPVDAEPWFSQQISTMVRRRNGEAENLKPLEATGTSPHKTFH